ncbi:sulfite exporter TauE/SafE family protein [Candidatus Woesearchaeota archaeon]|nr:sulfite exporter TauE/SafE family protein [Candidatus Woesearchaeota archaeon]
MDNIIKKGFIAEGTTCPSCEKIIKKQALKVEGVQDVTFDLSKEVGYVTFDKTKTDIDKILYSIEEKGYTCYILDESSPLSQNNPNKAFNFILLVVGILIAGYFLLNFASTISMPEISENMGYGLLFIVGLLTGFHCISMCGGFVVSYTAKNPDEHPHLLHTKYAIGKTLSYTIIGAAFGLLGSIIAFTPLMRGVAGILAGLFLILFGLNMLNVFPILRKVRIPLPSSVAKLTRNKTNSPFVIGLLNGLMIACGPLQAIYIMAAGTGSMIEGAKTLFVFGLGTLPVMLGFGYITSFISKKATHKLLKASGVIVILLGLIMVNRGLALTGSGYDLSSLTAGSPITGGSVNMEDDFQVIEMTVDRYGWTPDNFVLKKGVPVKWKINGKEVTGCNNAINVPKLGLEFDIKEGEQVIEFTPEEVGTISWSCWMGMIPGTFIVTDDIDSVEQVQVAETSAPTTKTAGSCGGSCGGSTCGAKTGGSCGCGAR